MKKTVIGSLIDELRENNDLTNSEIITTLENALMEERRQIMDAFDEGLEYGRSKLQTFDYPASRYYWSTYKSNKEE